MKLIKRPEVYFFDIDNTLVTHVPNGELADISIHDPYDGEIVHLKRHEAHIKLLKRSKARGAAVIVWSLGGPKWIKLICDILEITKYVDIGVNKPRAYVDDKKDCNEWMGSHIFIDPNKGWGA